MQQQDKKKPNKHYFWVIIKTSKWTILKTDETSWLEINSCRHTHGHPWTQAHKPTGVDFHIQVYPFPKPHSGKKLPTKFKWNISYRVWRDFVLHPTESTLLSGSRFDVLEYITYLKVSTIFWLVGSF